jgi:hypothetical protein
LALSVKKLAVGVVRLAAMSQLGPLAGGLFLAGGAVARKMPAESEWAKTSAEMLIHLASEKASERFGSAAEGFRSGRNGDVEKSMRKAALEALARFAICGGAGWSRFSPVGAELMPNWRWSRLCASSGRTIPTWPCSVTRR